MNTNDNVIWKDVIIDGIKTNYEVNNIGQVRNKLTKRILTPSTSKSKDKYLHVSIYVDYMKITRNIHRLVAQAFIENDDLIHKTQVNHRDGNKLNNCIENLEWCTPSENTKHAYRIGLEHYTPKFGSDNPNNKYSEFCIHQICKMLSENVPIVLISKLINIDTKYISHINKGCEWRHISSQYNINYKEKYKKYKKIKYNKLRKILIELNIFDDINLLDLLESNHIIKKRKLITDLENLGYIIFIDSELMKEL